jgi:hypothetical protein
MFTHLIIQLNLCKQSRGNPIYGSLIRLGLVFTDVPIPCSAGLSPQQKTRTRRAWGCLGVLEKAQALRSLLMRSSHSGLVGAGVAGGAADASAMTCQA